MQELIRFSLNRRFKNKATIIFNVIVFIMISILSFSDVLLDIFLPSVLSTKTVYTRNIDDNLRAYLNNNANDDYEFKVLSENEKTCVDEGNIVFKYDKGDYVLFSKYKLEDTIVITFESMLKQYHQMNIVQDEKDYDFIEQYEMNYEIENKVLYSNIDMSEEKSTILFIFISAAYFMMLSFVSGVVSEVVNEKTTKTLELILTSVNAKIHFYAKLIVGWFVIILQGCLSMSYIIIWLIIRNIYDRGKGLIILVNKLHLITIEQKTIHQILSNLDLNLAFFIKLFWIIIFILLGILLLQLLMVLTSCFVSTIEEAANIQAPFYLLLLVIYYVALALNTPEQLSEGIAYYLSFVPFMNMLFMPCRLLIQDVPLIELALSCAITSSLVYFLLIKGIPIYEEGVLDYSNKGFIEIIKKIYNINKKINVE